jgi:DNA-binding NarL/FixJ family response regulator
MTIRVLLADDQNLPRQTNRILIDSCSDMTVVGEATNGRQAVDLARRHRPEVVVMDLGVLATDGLSATRTIRADRNLSTTRVLVHATYELDGYLTEALHAGASGFLGKDIGAHQFLSGIRVIAAGYTLLPPEAARTLTTRFPTAAHTAKHPPA